MTECCSIPKLTARSVFSGIESWSVACKNLPIKTISVSEIDKQPNKLLEHHYPNTPNLGDISKIDWSVHSEPYDILIGGSPCQSFSVAGLRRGLSDERGNLMFEYLRAVKETKPRWVIWENVPGVLSSNKGKDFGTLLGALEEFGYGFAYRVLDAQFFGVAQRRRRVFVIGCAGGQWQRAAAVLFDSESVSWNTQTSKEKRTELTRDTTASTSYSIAGNIIGRQSHNGGNGLGVDEGIAYTLTSADRHGVLCMGTQQGGAELADNFCPTITAAAGMSGNNQPVICMGSDDNTNASINVELGATLTAHDDRGAPKVCTDVHAVLHTTQTPPTIHMSSDHTNASINTELSATQLASMHRGVIFQQDGGEENIVRRLTPLECERLQGFPDNYTNVAGLSDSARYKTLGNSMAVPVMRWLAERILMVERYEYE